MTVHPNVDGGIRVDTTLGMFDHGPWGKSCNLAFGPDDIVQIPVGIGASFSAALQWSTTGMSTATVEAPSTIAVADTHDKGWARHRIRDLAGIDVQQTFGRNIVRLRFRDGRKPVEYRALVRALTPQLRLLAKRYPNLVDEHGFEGLLGWLRSL